MKRVIVGAVVTLSTGALAQAQDVTYPQPTLPAAGIVWPFCVLMVIAVIFLAAAVIGPIVRAEMPEELPPVHSHDEPPGASHHHGRSGLRNPNPEDTIR